MQNRRTQQQNFGSWEALRQMVNDLADSRILKQKLVLFSIFYNQFFLPKYRGHLSVLLDIISLFLQATKYFLVLLPLHQLLKQAAINMCIECFHVPANIISALIVILVPTLSTCESFLQKIPKGRGGIFKFLINVAKFSFKLVVTHHIPAHGV